METVTKATDWCSLSASHKLVPRLMSVSKLIDCSMSVSPKLVTSSCSWLAGSLVVFNMVNTRLTSSQIALKKSPVTKGKPSGNDILVILIHCRKSPKANADMTSPARSSLGKSCDLQRWSDSRDRSWWLGMWTYKPMSKEEEKNLLFLSFDGKTFFTFLIYVWNST